MISTALQAIKDYSTVVRERHSVRKYDPDWQISEEELKEILAEAALAPSSSNLQPWRFLVFHSQELKQKLLPIAFNQQQIVNASATIAVLGDIEGYKRAERVNGVGVEKGYMTPEFAEQSTANSQKLYGGLSAEHRKNIALVDGGLVSMQLMLSAKARGYDTVPMGGFNAAELIEEFGIPANLVPVMLIAIGKAAAPGRLTPRLPIEEITYWNGQGMN